MRHNPDDFPEEQREVIRMLNVVIDAHKDGRLPGLQMCSPDSAARRVKITLWPDDRHARLTLAELLPANNVDIAIQRIDAGAG